MLNVAPYPAPPRNRLLARLPATELARIEPLLNTIKLARGRTLYEPGRSIDYAYFPTGAVLSALVVMEDGGVIEVATVGNEGLVGYAAAIGTGRSTNRVIAQVGGGGFQIEVATLRREIARGGLLGALLAEYQAAFMTQVSQSVACNGLHRLEQRCCRWLLMTRDRTNSDDLRLTHEFLAVMLGARRASVSEALHPLQEAGLVRSRRGTIAILDRAGLETRSCECYRVVKAEYDRFLGNSP